MFDDIPPPKAPKTPADKAKATRLRKSKARALRQAYKEMQTEERKLRTVREKIDRRRKAVHAVADALEKGGIVTPTEIVEAPSLLRREAVSREIAFEPNPGPQTEFLAASEREVFYGGARGGGKSYSLIVDPLRYCDKEIARALILRRTMPELRDLINHSIRLYTKAYPGAKWRDQEKEWRFPSGARIEFGYAETRQDALRYQGQSYTWIGVDELPQFPGPEIWNDLRGSLRSVDPTVPEFMRATGNPGNVGSGWVKETFIDPAPPNQRFVIEIDLPDGTKSHITRRFIPAKLADNPYLTRTKSYMTMLASLPEVQRRQWLLGDWQIWDGAAFPEFKREVHVCEPFDLPKTWIRFRACDWGYSSPAVCLWFAVDYNDNIYVYRELKTIQVTDDVFAKRVLDLERGEKIQYGVMDSSVWSRRGDIGPSIPETMQRIGCRWRPSDRSPGSRRSGKAELHRRLALTNQGRDGLQPSIKFFNTCRNVINEIPSLPLSDTDPEDINTKANDHSYDAVRYGIMSRPMNATRIDMIVRQNLQNQYVPFDTQFGY